MTTDTDLEAMYVAVYRDPSANFPVPVIHAFIKAIYRLGFRIVRAES